MKRLFAIVFLCGFLIPCAYGEVLKFEGSVYIGRLLNHAPNGYGAFYFYDGRGEYVGNFKNSKFHGRGVLTSEDGHVYLGEWNRAEQQGPGIAVDLKTISIGDFNKGQMWDTVVFDWTGNILGTVSNGADCRGCDPKSNHKLMTLTHGRYASIPYEDGIYIGDVFNGKPHGFGVLKLPQDIFVMGEWNLGVPTGHVYLDFSSFTPPVKYIGGISLTTGFEGMATVITEYFRYIGTFKNNGVWNGTLYAPSGEAIATATNGERRIVAQPANTNESSESGLSVLLYMIGAFFQGYAQQGTQGDTWSESGGGSLLPSTGECLNNHDCGLWLTCVQSPGGGHGRCLKAVDSSGSQILPIPFGPRMGEPTWSGRVSAGCITPSDCPSGYFCDLTLRVCVR